MGSAWHRLLTVDNISYLAPNLTPRHLKPDLSKTNWPPGMTYTTFMMSSRQEVKGTTNVDNDDITPYMYCMRNTNRKWIQNNIVGSETVDPSKEYLQVLWMQALLPRRHRGHIDPNARLADAVDWTTTKHRY